MRTQVGIIGAGPAGLLLSHLLSQKGIDSVVIESRSRFYVEGRVRAGVLEQGTVNLLVDAGLGQRLMKEGMHHHGIEVRASGESHRIDLDSLTGGRGITVYGQQEVVKDLISTREQQNGEMIFEAQDVEILGIHTEKPKVRFSQAGGQHELECDWIAGCDGFYGVSRNSIPDSEIRSFSREYPFAWLGILVEAPPSSDELIYANHENGFALHSMRSKERTRNYIQCDPHDKIEDWSEDRIWEELHSRLETISGWKLLEGKILEKGITPMRSYVCETMSFGRLFLAGDAAHIVPPTGAKGMNLAISDVRYLSAALVAWYESKSEGLLAQYAENCLRHIWRGEHFSWYMTKLLHKFPDGSLFDERLQKSELEYLFRSEAASKSLAENYVGFSFE